jgi:hypothetical protein
MHSSSPIEDREMKDSIWEDLPDLQINWLTDAHGVFGIQLPAYASLGETQIYATRPDKVHLSEEDLVAMMQCFGPWLIRRQVEEKIRAEVFRCLRERAGFPRQCLSYGKVFDWWSDTPSGKAKNRRLYYALKHRSNRMTNSIIAKLLEVADPGALRIARRFPPTYRFDIYRHAARSQRFLQVAKTFPLLAVRAARRDPQSNSVLLQMIEDGRPLRKISPRVRALRRIRPGAVQDVGIPGSVLPFLLDHPQLVRAFCPDKLPAQRRWLRAVLAAGSHCDEFADWVARRFDASQPRTLPEVEDNIVDIGDFVRASHLSRVPRETSEMEHAENKTLSDLVVRRFSPAMSWNTVVGLSQQWHEAIADQELDGDDETFPEPWGPNTIVKGYEIIPIQTASELYREGAKMRHCAATYRDRLRRGDCNVFSLRQDGKRVATIELLVGKNNHPSLGQVRGPCNALASTETMRLLRRWVRSLPMIPEQPHSPPTCLSSSPQKDVSPATALTISSRVGSFPAPKT